jgi:hypothetical protein
VAAAAAAVAAALLQRRKLKLKATLERRVSCFSVKLIVPGAFKTWVSSVQRALPYLFSGELLMSGGSLLSGGLIIAAEVENERRS